MKLLLDTHLLLWAVLDQSFLPVAAADLIQNPENTLYFSTVSVWEVAIKYSLQKPFFSEHPRDFRRSLTQAGYIELALTSEQIFTIPDLPPIHRDPFDRILIAQAIVEDIQLLTSDALNTQYPGPILKV